MSQTEPKLPSILSLRSMAPALIVASIAIGELCLIALYAIGYDVGAA